MITGSLKHCKTILLLKNSVGKAFLGSCMHDPYGPSTSGERVKAMVTHMQ